MADLTHRRSFLQFLALAPAAAAVPFKPAEAAVLTIKEVHRCRDLMEAQEFANRYRSQMLRIMNETAKGRLCA